MEEKYLKSIIDLLEPKSKMSSVSVKLSVFALAFGLGIFILNKIGFLSGNSSLMFIGFIAGFVAAKVETCHGIYNFLAPHINKNTIKEKLASKV